ncbi:MAG: sigma-54 dependent transcriptional regulator [Methylococcales bacterium]
MSDSLLPKVLLVEDSASLALVYTDYLRHEKIQLHYCSQGVEAITFIENNLPEVIFLDLKLPGMNGMDILKYVHEQKLPCTVVIITAHGSVNVALDAMRYGAFDFIEKPFTAKRLLLTLRNALNSRALTDEVDHFRQNTRSQYHGFFGESPVMQSVYRIIDNASQSKATLFITGESGTGKEVCAHAVHNQSPRKHQPFIALNCAAIPKDLMESEIFGHVKGAFTGAVKHRQGAASQAAGGTLFLDEICELDIALQSKLLRFVQTGCIQQVGGTTTEDLDVRFICATNRNPVEEVQAGRFREDLFYRLHVIPIPLPSLRERGNDILLIAEHFLAIFSAEENKKFIGLSPESKIAFLAYSWPGNIRELQNVIRTIIVLNNDTLIQKHMLPSTLNPTVRIEKKIQAMVTNKTVGFCPEQENIIPLALLEKRAIEYAIAYCDGNVPQAAALLAVSPSTIYRKKQAWQNAADSDQLSSSKA